MTWSLLDRAPEDDLLLVNSATILHVSYDLTGPQFTHIVGPVLDEETLAELADDMQLAAGGVARCMEAA